MVQNRLLDQGPEAKGHVADGGGQKTQKNPKTHRTLKLMVEYPHTRFWAIWGSYVDFRPLLRGNISFVIFSLLRLRGRRNFAQVQKIVKIGSKVAKNH